jgi:hypothetical protein
MSEHTEEYAGAAAGTGQNTHGPAPLGAGDQAAAPAAAEPCGCADRLAGVERIARTAGYLALIAAAAVIYLLWSSGQEGGK